MSKRNGLPRGVKPTANGKWRAMHNNRLLAIFDTVERAQQCYVEHVRKIRRETWEGLGGGVYKKNTKFYGYAGKNQYVGKFATEKEAREAIAIVKAQQPVSKKLPKNVVQLESGKFKATYKRQEIGEFNNADDARAAVEQRRKETKNENLVYIGDGIVYNKTANKFYLHRYDAGKARQSYQGVFDTETDARDHIAKLLADKKQKTNDLPTKPKRIRAKKQTVKTVKVAKVAIKAKKPEIVSTFADKRTEAKQKTISNGALNRAIAELNDSLRTTEKRLKPTISQLAMAAKQQANPRQYYLEQLKAGAYNA